jgi:O-antigen ligase
VLATFLSLFLGVPRRAAARRVLCGLLLVFFVLLVAFSFGALRETTGAAGRLAHHLPVLGAAGAVGLVFLAALTWLAWRYPDYAVPVLVVLLPLRVPLPLGSTTSSLLVPLYLVLLAIAIAEILVRDRLRLPEGWRPEPVRIALAALIAVIGISALWVGLRYAPHPKAFADALIKLFAFYLPFGLLYYVIYRYASTAQRLRNLIVALVGAGVVAAVFGIIQYPTRIVIMNKAGIARSLEFQHTFRSNSFFWDPNMFGRFLALVILLGGAMYLAARLRDRAENDSRFDRWFFGGAVALAALAFVFTFSRSGVAALATGAIVLELAWLGRRRGLIVVALTVLVLAIGLIGITDMRQPTHVRAKLSTKYGLNKLTGGRYFLVVAGEHMFEHHPVAGIGLGGFPLAFPKYRTSTAANLNLRDSHTTPVTIAAEQGLLGLAAYIGLLVTFFATALRKRRFGADRRLYLWQAGLVAGVVAVLAASLSYNAFFEDPYLWAFMAMSSAMVTRIVAPPSDVLPPAAPPDASPAEAGDERRRSVPTA